MILKPSIDSNSGQGVQLFIRKDEDFINSKTGDRLTESYLLNYGPDFILQEALEQSPYICQFNPSSINTLRLVTYRSVKDESVHVVASIIRIGKHGEFVDNAHAGSRFVGVDLKTGVLNNYACDQYGNKSPRWNEVDFSKDKYTIPNWNAVLDFARYVGNCIHHCRLLQLDIALDKNDIPRLIEYNNESMSYWLYMFSGQHPFSEFNDEIFDYCLKKRNKIL
jgi:hypothetical protein